MLRGLRRAGVGRLERHRPRSAADALDEFERRRRRSRPASGRARDCRSGRCASKPLSLDAALRRQEVAAEARDAARPSAPSSACRRPAARGVSAALPRKSIGEVDVDRPRRRARWHRSRRRSRARRCFRRRAAAAAACPSAATAGLAPSPRGSLTPKRSSARVRSIVARRRRRAARDPAGRRSAPCR